jgi:hypothetical protein
MVLQISFLKSKVSLYLQMTWEVDNENLVKSMEMEFD